MSRCRESALTIKMRATEPRILEGYSTLSKDELEQELWSCLEWIDQIRLGDSDESTKPFVCARIDRLTELLDM